MLLKTSWLPLVFILALTLNLLGLARHFGGLFFGPPSRHQLLRQFTSTSPLTIMSNPQALPVFLKQSKTEYLAAVANGTAHDWVVAMGNEAGDLDSIASAIGYSWFASTVQHTPTVALVQTARDDLRLRAENLRALSLAGLSATSEELLCLSDLPSGPFPSSKFALVDHNRLGGSFEQESAGVARVVAVVDHHADEGLYKDTADPRIITAPTGSCSSLVAELIEGDAAEPEPEGIPRGLATLLLSAVLLDTNGLKEGGKAEPVDRAAAVFLAARSTLDIPEDSLGGELHDVPAIKDLNEELQDIKASVANLSTRDLLRRDYKEYTFVPSWSAPPSGAAPSSTPAGLLVGLASVPTGFKSWFASAHAQDGAFWRETQGWVEERSLDALGVLTSFHDEDTLNKKGKPKKRREQLWVLRPPPAGSPAEGLPQRLWEGLSASAELELRDQSFSDLGAEGPDSVLAEGWEARVFKQKNTDATRKITAPVVRAIIEGPQSSEGDNANGKL